MWNKQSSTNSNNYNQKTKVQDEKYKKFDAESSHNQLALPLNSNDQNQEQTQSSQKVDINQKVPYFIAIPINQNPQILKNNNNLSLEEYLSQNLVKLNSSQVLLKDLNFTKQSEHAILSLLLLVIQHICLFFGVIQVFDQLQQSITDTSPYYLFIYVPLYLMVLFLSNSNFFRKFPFSLLLYFLNILLTSLIIFYFCTIFRRQRKEKFDATDYDNASIGCCLIILLNLLEVIVIMAYICVENKKIQFIIILPILILICNFFLVIEIKLYVILIPSFLYGVLLLNVINQSFKGRFCLKQWQILGTTNSYNFGIIIPFQFWKF